MFTGTLIQLPLASMRILALNLLVSHPTRAVFILFLCISFSFLWQGPRYKHIMATKLSLSTSFLDLSVSFEIILNFVVCSFSDSLTERV